METIYVTIFLTTSAGVIGFLLRMFMDNINDVLKNKRLKRTEHIEFLLSEFYMPIYILLHRENIIWDKIVSAQIKDCEIIKELDNENLNNHLEIQKLIMSNMAKASPRNDIAEQLIKYDEHVTIFKTLRKIGSNDFPIKYNSEYPTQLCDLIEKRIAELKEDKRILLGFFGNTPNLYIRICNMKKLFYSKFNTNSSQYNKSNNITSQSSPFTLDRVITDNNIDIELTNQTSDNNNDNAV
jgi:hypothetical protein